MQVEDRRSRVLIAGCGYVGSALAERLVSRGHEVWGLRRSAAGLPTGVRPWEADLRIPGSLERLPARFDVVFYTAAPDPGDPVGYDSTYVQGPRNLLTALQRQEQAPRRIVFTSSTGVYAQRSGEWIDEDSPTEPSTDSARALLIGERVFGASGFPTTVVRFGGIYGPGRTRLVDEVAAGVARCPPGEPRWSNRIHLDDCSGVLDHLMQIAKPADLYVGVDREPAPFCEVIRWIAKRLGAAEPPIGEPPAAALTARSRRLTNKRCSSARLAASGYRFVHATYREGFASLIAGSSSRSGERSPS